MNPEVNTALKDKTVLVTGGTGSFGCRIVKSLLEMPVKKVLILSRDEFKQSKLKHELDHADKLEFVIGDVRDYNSIFEASKFVDVIFHAAAMKHVPICEEHPMQAVKTNVIGAENIRKAAIENGVDTVLAISTDKAVRPVNVMGMTKSIQERILLAPKHPEVKTKFTCVRFGNVVGSSGSAVPIFVDKIKHNKPIPITDERMTRFFMTLSDSLDLIYACFLEGDHGEIFVQKMQVAKTVDLAKTLIKALSDNADYPLKHIGIRKGEQLYESLVSEEEIGRVREYDDHFVVLPYDSEKEPLLQSAIQEYRSDMVKSVMNEEEILDQLKRAGVL